MAREEIVALLSRYQSALAQRDASALADMYAPDGVLESPAAGGTARGRDGVRDLYAAWFKAFPDLSITADPPIVDGARAALLFTVTGTDTGGFLGMDPTHKPFRLSLVLLCEIDGGAITRARSIYDFSGMLIQLGVLKVKTT